MWFRWYQFVWIGREWDVCLLFIFSFWYFAMSIVKYAFRCALNFMVWWYPRKQWNLCSTNINEFTVYDDVYLPSYHSRYCYRIERTKPQKHISSSSYLHGHLTLPHLILHLNLSFNLHFKIIYLVKYLFFIHSLIE
jgi:hypothetical protein